MNYTIFKGVLGLVCVIAASILLIQGGEQKEHLALWFFILSIFWVDKP